MAGKDSREQGNYQDDTAIWSGLSGLSEAQRSELAAGVAPRVVDHLDQCMEWVATEWSAGRVWGDQESDAVEWANQLHGYQYVLRREFEEALNRDLRTTTYPPEYDFSGTRYAGGDSGLQVLDDYQSTRRSLRHKLEGVIREHNRYSYYMFQQAAREEHRFEHPGWAPWSPLHWYERVIEAAERQFGRTAMTLDLMRAYVKCMGRTGAPMLAFVVETIDECGLVTEPPRSPEAHESESVPQQRASWAHYTAGSPPRSASESTAGGDPATLGLGAAGSSGTREMPAPDADPTAWAMWARALVQAQGLPASSPHAAGVPDGAGSGAGGAGGERVAPESAEFSRESLTPFILDLLQGMFDHIFRQVGFNSRVRAAIADMQFSLARVVIRDLSFFRDRSHPLRLWIGSLINTGVRVSPDDQAAGNDAIEAYLQHIQESVNRLRHEADSMDRDAAQALLDDWLAAIEEEDARWQEQQGPHIDPLRQEERAARARRSLTICVLETGAELPERSAEQIAEAWEDLLAADGDSAERLDQVVKDVAKAICNRATPQEVNPMVQRIVATAREAGVSEERVKAVVQHLGQAHLQRIRASGDEPRFDPQERIRARRSIRFEDDDPDLLADQDDPYVFEASRVQVGDWFEFIDKATGETQRMALVWRGEATRRFLFLSLDGVASRRHSLQGVAHEMREGRMRALPRDNPLDAMIR
ncbi:MULTISPECIES: DUF1631 family protein [unclassified Thioalkalivibrio]|uniref:DUF1631 family protein n=1 Tax=unclassified Thioalkalivibrio TaxID=2621013 RepID=UPI000374F02C|nr:MULTISPECIES: DUF1631 family protein [unclassified Thioalkalivibrio]